MALYVESTKFSSRFITGIRVNKRKMLFTKMALLDFIQEEGEPNSTNRNVWRPLDVGIRVMNWLKSLTYISIADYKQLGIDKVLRNALLVHLEYLERSYIDKYRLSNWGVLVTGGMAAMDLFLPELVNRVN